jgi:biotin carboxylase
VVREVRGARWARHLPGVTDLEVTVAAGGTVRPVRSSADRCGHVIATGADVAEAAARCDAAVAAVEIVTC